MVNESLMPSGANDEELVLDVAVEECHDAATTVSINFDVGENASRQLVDDSTGDDA